LFSDFLSDLTRFSSLPFSAPFSALAAAAADKDMMGNEAPRTGGGGGPSTPPPRLRTGELSTPRTPVECPYERFALDGEGSGGLGAGGGLGGGGAAAPMDTRRTAEAIAAAPRGNDQADRGGLAFQALPQGPWATSKLASDVFATLSKGEGHVLNASSTRGATKLRGAEFALICPFGVKLKARESTAKAKEDDGRQSFNFNHCNNLDNLCKWKIIFEESTTGWVIKSAVLVHCEHPTRSTPRELSAAEREATYSRGQKIPDQLLNLVTNDMKLLQPSVREIHTFIDKKAQELGITIAWEYNDVYNIFRSSPGNEAVAGVLMQKRTHGGRGVGPRSGITVIAAPGAKTASVIPQMGHVISPTCGYN